MLKGLGVNSSLDQVIQYYICVNILLFKSIVWDALITSALIALKQIEETIVNTPYILYYRILFHKVYFTIESRVKKKFRK